MCQGSLLVTLRHDQQDSMEMGQQRELDEPEIIRGKCKLKMQNTTQQIKRNASAGRKAFNKNWGAAGHVPLDH